MTRRDRKEIKRIKENNYIRYCARKRRDRQLNNPLVRTLRAEFAATRAIFGDRPSDVEEPR